MPRTGQVARATVKFICGLGLLLFAAATSSGAVASGKVELRTWVALLPGDGIALVTVSNVTLAKHELGQPIDWTAFEYPTRVVLCPDDDIWGGKKASGNESLTLTRFSIVLGSGWTRTSGPSREFKQVSAQSPPLRINERLVEGSIYAFAIEPSFSAVAIPDKLMLIQDLCAREYRDAHRVAFVERGPVEYVAFPNPSNPGSLTIRFVGDPERGSKYKLLRVYDPDKVVEEQFWTGTFTYFRDGPRTFDERDLESIAAALPGLAETLVRSRGVIAVLATLGALLGGFFGNLTLLSRLGFRPSALPAVESVSAFIGQQVGFFATWRGLRTALMIVAMSIVALLWKDAISRMIEARRTPLRQGEQITQFFFGTEVSIGVPLSFAALLALWGVIHWRWFSSFGTRRDAIGFWSYPFLLLLSAVLLSGLDNPTYLLVAGLGSTCLWMHWLGIEEAHRTIRFQGSRAVDINFGDRVVRATILLHTPKWILAIRAVDGAPVMMDATKISSIDPTVPVRIVVD